MSKSLRELAEVYYGKSPTEVLTNDSGIPIIGTGGVYGRASRAMFSVPAVVVPRKGSLGNPQYVSEPFWPVDTTYAVIPKSGVDAKWLYYSLAAFDLTKLNEATGVPSISRDWLYKVPLGSTEYGEQRRIAEILSTLDETIEQTAALIAKYQQIKAGLMHDLFTRGVMPDGKLRLTYAEAPQLYKESPLGWIPTEWNCNSLADSCELLKDGTHLPPLRVSSGPLLLSVQNMIDGYLRLTTSDTRVPEDFYAQMHRSWVIKPNDVLLAIVGATIGKVCRVPENFPKFTLQRSVCVLRGKLGVLRNRFLYWYLLTPAFKNLLWERVNQTAQPGIYLVQIGKIIAPNPPREEQCLISRVLEATENSIGSMKDELAKLHQQKHGLMHDLLTRRVRVQVDEH